MFLVIKTSLPSSNSTCKTESVCFNSSSNAYIFKLLRNQIDKSLKRWQAVNKNNNNNRFVCHDGIRAHRSFQNEETCFFILDKITCSFQNKFFSIFQSMKFNSCVKDFSYYCKNLWQVLRFLAFWRKQVSFVYIQIVAWCYLLFIAWCYLLFMKEMLLDAPGGGLSILEMGQNWDGKGFF